MEQVTLRIDDMFLEKMKIRTEKNNCKTISQCARELMDLGMRVEEAAAAQDENNVGADINPDLMDILKSSLTWLLEVRFLTKYIASHHQKNEQGERVNFIEKANEKATLYAEETINQLKNGKKKMIND
jgi:hypothetical protein